MGFNNFTAGINRIFKFEYMEAIKRIDTQYMPKAGEAYPTESLEYDKEGNLILSIKYDPDGQVIEKIVTDYDSKGLKAKEEIYYSENELAETSCYEYDENKKLVKIITDYTAGYQTITEYIRKENRLEIRQVDEEGEVEETEIFMYNDEGKIIEKQILNDRGKLTEKQVSIYDSEGQLVQRDILERKNKLALRRSYRYNDNGQPIEIKVTNRKGKLVEYYRLEYDDANRPISQNTPQGRIELEYPDKGIQKERYYDAGGTLQQKLTRYTDDAGNVLKEESPLGTTEYKYTYFE